MTLHQEGEEAFRDRVEVGGQTLLQGKNRAAKGLEFSKAMVPNLSPGAVMS